MENLNDTTILLIMSLAVIVGIAILGILITIGNNRQARELKNIHKSIALWAKDDITRKRADHKVDIASAEDWFVDLIGKIKGAYPVIAEIRDWRDGNGNRALVVDTATTGRFVFTPLKIDEIIKVEKRRSKDKMKISDELVPGNSKKNGVTYMLDVTTAGAYFDQEAATVWRMYFREDLPTDYLNVLEIPDKTPPNPQAEEFVNKSVAA